MYKIINVGKWLSGCVNDIIINYANNNKIEWYNNHYFQIVIIINNIHYVINDYKCMRNNTLLVKFKKVG